MAETVLVPRAAFVTRPRGYCFRPPGPGEYGGFALPGDGAAEQVRRATCIAADGGVDSVFVWGWDACRVISSIGTTDHDAVWNTYLDELPDE